jgi:hypothetical protein
MSRIFVPLMVLSLLVAAGCKRDTPPPAEPETAALAEARVVETACGVCIFGMEGRGCPLAVKIDGKPYLVTGASVNAHTAGLCEAARSATVTGQIEGDKFVATSFDLRP